MVNKILQRSSDQWVARASAEFTTGTRKYYNQVYRLMFELMSLYFLYLSSDQWVTRTNTEFTRGFRGRMTRCIYFWVCVCMISMLFCLCVSHMSVYFPYLSLQISELLELLLSLLEVRGKNDQVYRLMFEPAMGELLYMLLTQEEYSGTLKEKVLRVSYLKIIYCWKYYFVA